MIADWDLEEVVLLHKSIVILPEDQERKTVAAEKPLTYEKGTPKKKATAQLKPYLVFFCENNKEYYTKPDAAFQKIIKNLGLTHLNEYLFPISSITDFSTSFPKGIWIIGTPPKSVTIPADCLQTPNPDDLQTTEEKKAVYQEVVAYSGRLKL